METRFCIFLLKQLRPVMALFLLITSQHLHADDSALSTTEYNIVPDLPRRDISEAQIDTENFEITAFAGVMSVEDFGTSSIYGIRAAFHITEDFFAEASAGWTETEKTSYENLSGGVNLLTDDQRKLNYYNLSLGYNLLPGEVFIDQNYAFNTALYFIAGVGSTNFAGDNRFTLNVGAGYRVLVTDTIALHIDVRDHMFDIDLLGTDKTTHNIELTGGLAIFF